MRMPEHLHISAVWADHLTLAVAALAESAMPQAMPAKPAVRMAVVVVADIALPFLLRVVQVRPALSSSNFLPNE